MFSPRFPRNVCLRRLNLDMNRISLLGDNERFEVVSVSGKQLGKVISWS
jgi:hypothetical protein